MHCIALCFYLDHRHFEMVIQRLQAANRTETESNADDSAAAVTGDVDDDDGGEEESNGEANNVCDMIHITLSSY